SVLAVTADLHQELALLGELQDLRIALAVAADPDVALVVHVDAVIGFRPLVALAGTAPRADQVAGLVENQYRGRGPAAFGNRRIQLQAALVVVQAARAAMYDPDVILLVDPEPYRPAHQPVIGQRLGPQGIALEHGRLDRAALRVRAVLKPGLADAER